VKRFIAIISITELKVYAAFDSSQLVNQENINAPDKIRVAVNNNFYFNTYNGRFGSGWQLVSGYGYSKTK
jgi:hypothetical protein